MALFYLFFALSITHELLDLYGDWLLLSPAVGSGARAVPSKIGALQRVWAKSRSYLGS